MQIVGLITRKDLPEIDCIEWVGAKKQGGYGRVKFRGKIELSHRVSYSLYNDTDLSELVGVVIRHKCDNQGCINPRHLLAGTVKDNMRDAVDRGRHKHPVLKGTKHGRARLVDSDVLHIRNLLSDNYSRDESLRLANQYGVSESTINAIHYRRNWRHI